MKDSIQITDNIYLEIELTDLGDSWFYTGRYINSTGHQIGEAWAQPTRDLVLINRPAL